MNIMSLFDGCSGAQASLSKLGIKADNYFASEVDQYAIKIAQKNYPDTIQMGDVKGVSIDKTFPKINLLVAGSPCQDLSFARIGKGLEGTQSNLFFEYARVLKELREINGDIKFLLENVRMKQANQDTISDLLGVEPILINSAKLSAQNRPRLYWTNIEGVREPDDKGIVLSDILEKGITQDSELFRGGKLKTYFGKKHRGKLGYSKDGLCHIGDANLKGHDSLLRVYHESGKAPTLNSMQGGNREPKVFIAPHSYRKLTVLECERLQGFSDNYTEGGVSNSQRYKMLGNGFQIDTVSHILKNMGAV